MSGLIGERAAGAMARDGTFAGLDPEVAPIANCKMEPKAGDESGDFARNSKNSWVGCLGWLGRMTAGISRGVAEGAERGLGRETTNHKN